MCVRERERRGVCVREREREAPLEGGAKVGVPVKEKLPKIPLQKEVMENIRSPEDDLSVDKKTHTHTHTHTPLPLKEVVQIIEEGEGVEAHVKVIVRKANANRTKEERVIKVGR